MPKVVILDDVAPEGLAVLDANNIEYEIRTKLKGEALKKTLAEFDGAICRSGVTITAECMPQGGRLKAIVRAGVGTDNIDKHAAALASIVVMNTPSGNTISTAEHAFALMLGLARNLAPAHQSLREGRWDRKQFMGTQLAGKTLGVVGLGRIGQEVAKRAIAFEMKVLGFDPMLSPDRARELGIEPVDTVAAMLPQVDFLTVHTPLTPATKNLIDADQIKTLKKGARLINCARGGIYNEAALAAAIESGGLAGVALDVYMEEPCTESPLFKLGGVLCTPHLGASTEEAQTEVAIEAAHLISNYLNKREVRHAVNFPSVDPGTLASLQGYIDVARRLGILLDGWRDGPLSKLHVRFKGEVCNKETQLLISALCAGLLESSQPDEISIVNARSRLENVLGVQVQKSDDPHGGVFSSSITVSALCGEEELVVGGTLFGNNMPRLFKMGKHRLEAYLDGVMLVFTHEDVPGIIGWVGNVFGEYEVNIGQMSVGRIEDTPGGRAIGILNLDSVPPSAALEKVLQHAGIHSVKVIQMPSRSEHPPWL